MDEIAATTQYADPTQGETRHYSFEGLSTETLLEVALKRLADDPSRGAAIAQSAVEEALRQLRKRERRACG